MKAINNNLESQHESSDTLGSSENSISKDFSDSLDETERAVKNDIINEFFYFTPVSYVKHKYFIPSTPKKVKEKVDDEELIVRGRNLLDIFETM